MDLAISLDPQRKDEFEFRPLFTDELRFMVAPMHPWARAGRVERAEIPKQPCVLYSKVSYTFEEIDRYFGSEDIVLNLAVEMASMEAIKELVKRGLGVSVLAPWVAQKELEAGALVSLPLGKRTLKRTWGVLHRRGRRLSLAEETFINLCREATQAHGIAN